MIPLGKGIRIDTGSSSRDGTGTIVPIVTAPPGGVGISRVLVVAEAATTAGMIRLYVSSLESGGWRLVHELPVSAITPSGTVAAWTGTWTPAGDGFTLLEGAQLGAATEESEPFVLHPEAFDPRDKHS